MKAKARKSMTGAAAVITALAVLAGCGAPKNGFRTDQHLCRTGRDQWCSKRHQSGRAPHCGRADYLNCRSLSLFLLLPGCMGGFGLDKTTSGSKRHHFGIQSL